MGLVGNMSWSSAMQSFNLPPERMSSLVKMNSTSKISHRMNWTSSITSKGKKKSWNMTPDSSQFHLWSLSSISFSCIQPIWLFYQTSLKKSCILEISIQSSSETHVLICMASKCSLLAKEIRLKFLSLRTKTVMLGNNIWRRATFDKLLRIVKQAKNHM